MKKTSKHLMMLFSLTLAAVLLAGCGNSSSDSTGGVSNTTSEQSDKSETSSDSTASDINPAVLGTFEFSFTCHDPDTSAKVIYMKSLCDEVYEKTNGGVKMTMYTSGTLVASTDVATAVEDGTADIGWLFTTFFPGEFIYTDIITMPMTYDSSLQACDVLIQLINNNSLVQEELSRYHVLSASTNPMNNIYTNIEINGVDSFKGQNWRATSGVATEFAKILGAAPISMGPGDMYESIEKNVLDGYIYEASGVKSFNLQECTNYYLDVDLFCGVFLVVMNNDAWNSLPVEYQEIITEVWEKGSMGQAEVFMDDAEDALVEYEAAGLAAVEADDEMMAALEAAAEEYVRYYIETYDCEDLYNEAVEYAALSSY